MRIVSQSRLIIQSLIVTKLMSLRDCFVLRYYGNTIFPLRACFAFREEEALGLSETILLREIFIKTIVDGGNNLLKDALFLLDERGWHIVWRLADLCLQQHFSFTNVDQYDFPQRSSVAER